MEESSPPDGARWSWSSEVATAVVDAAGAVLSCSREAAELLGAAPEDLHGVRLADLTADCPALLRHDAREAREATLASHGSARLRHRSGGTIDITYRSLALRRDPAETLVLAVPADVATDWSLGSALLRALLGQRQLWTALYGTDLRVVRTNVTPDMFGGLRPGDRLADVLCREDADAAESALRRVLDTGTPLVGLDQRMRSPREPGRSCRVALSAVRLQDDRGTPSGVAAVFTETTSQARSRRNLGLHHQASVRIGRSLDVRRTAQDLVDVLVPALGDMGWVELAESVLEGNEPPKVYGGGELHLRRVAVASSAGPWPAPLLQRDEAVPPLREAPSILSLQRGQATRIDRATTIARLGDPEHIRLLVPDTGHSAIAAPLFARGLALGTVALWRVGDSDPFDQEDAEFLGEIASRAALSVDNARRYTREHRQCVALQESLLPQPIVDLPAVHTAGMYVPAGGGVEISGDWFDVLPLPSMRVALVVGDVTGHGLAATATMGRLRTAIQTLADLELEPDELLTHLDDLVAKLAAEAAPGHRDTVGATCLCAVYDPVTRRCTLASAGHPPPLVMTPDGTCDRVSLAPGPPLGVGGMPFEVTAIDVEPDSVIALYTDGLLGLCDRAHDMDAGIEWVADRLMSLSSSNATLESVGHTLLAGARQSPPRDDVALLLARTRALPDTAVARWEFPADPAVVAQARDATTRQLTAWGIEESAFTAELVVSELVTNAVRYGGGPVGLRLIRGDALICEVTDSSNTQPRLRRARTTDEGGRGLFLVAQLSRKWGCRYGANGKTIWAEQALPAPPL
ncbi:SpoIIE family protein phosphatase [Streptomyces tendae]